MKARFILFRRRGVYYCEDTTTRKQASLRTREATAAQALLQAKNEAQRQPALNLQLARTYLSASDTETSTRTWQQVMAQIVDGKPPGPTRERWMTAIKNSALDALRDRKLSETLAEHFLDVLKLAPVSINVYLRRIHNYALDMSWLAWPVIPKARWPIIKHKEKRAITTEEHHLIINRELNLSTRAYYQMLWHLGGAQTDIAMLSAEDIDWQHHTIAYRRCKTGTTSLISFGEEVAAILSALPKEGYLFPNQARLHERHRSKQFSKRLATVGITGVSLHSYRYAWAERAMESGYPERFAMQALGHTSKAVHRAYSRRAQVTLPPLEEYERRAKAVIVPLPLAVGS